MQIILIQQINLKDINNGFKQIQKRINSNIIPHKGDYIADMAWNETEKYEVTKVIINYQEDYVQVWLKTINLETNDKLVLEDYVKMTKLYGWVCDFLFIENL